MMYLLALTRQVIRRAGERRLYDCTGALFVTKPALPPRLTSDVTCCRLLARVLLLLLSAHRPERQPDAVQRVGASAQSGASAGRSATCIAIAEPAAQGVAQPSWAPAPQPLGVAAGQVRGPPSPRALDQRRAECARPASPRITASNRARMATRRRTDASGTGWRRAPWLACGFGRALKPLRARSLAWKAACPRWRRWRGCAAGLHLPDS